MACTRCPSMGVDCSGGILKLLPAFSRADRGSTIDASSELHPCWNAAGCFVDLNTSATNRSFFVTHRCAHGYSGPLCGVCDAAADYAKSGSACVPCWSGLANAAVVVALPIGLLGLVVYIALYRDTGKSADSQVLFRILLTYIQTLGTLTSIYAARGTQAFRDLFGFTAVAGDSPLQLSPVQCALRIPFYARFGITVSLPFTMAVLCLLVSVASLACARLGNGGDVVAGAAGAGGGRALARAASMSEVVQHARSDVRSYFAKQQWLAPIIFVLNAAYSSLTSTCFSMFNCLPFTVAGVTYLAPDLSVTCFDDTHNLFRGLAGLLIGFFGLGFPALFAYLLHQRRTQLHEKEVFERLGFLYDGYVLENGLYAWESIVMMRKAAVVMIGSLVKDAWYQIAASITLMTFSLFLQAQNQPYETRLFNVIEAVAIVGIILTQLCSMFYLRVDSFAAACLGAEPTMIVDAQGTTCADIGSARAANDIIVTIAMVALNFLLVGGITMILVRTVVAEWREAKLAKAAGILAGKGSQGSKEPTMMRQRELHGATATHSAAGFKPPPAYSTHSAAGFKPPPAYSSLPLAAAAAAAVSPGHQLLSPSSALRSTRGGLGALGGSRIRMILPPLSVTQSLGNVARPDVPSGAETESSFVHLNPMASPKFNQTQPALPTSTFAAAPVAQGEAARLSALVSELTELQKSSSRALQREQARVAALRAESQAARAELEAAHLRTNRLLSKAEKSAAASATKKIEAARAAAEADAKSRLAKAEARVAEAEAEVKAARAEAAEANRAAASRFPPLLLHVDVEPRSSSKASDEPDPAAAASHARREEFSPTRADFIPLVSSESADHEFLDSSSGAPSSPPAVPDAKPEHFERRFDDEDEWFVSLLDGRSEWTLPRGAIVTGAREWRSPALAPETTAAGAANIAALEAAIAKAKQATEAAFAARNEALEAKRVANAAFAAASSLTPQSERQVLPTPAHSETLPSSPLPNAATSLSLSTVKSETAPAKPSHSTLQDFSHPGEIPPPSQTGPADAERKQTVQEFFQSRLPRSMFAPKQRARDA